MARSTICGISVGGQIALGLSHRHPDKVVRLILCCTGAGLARLARRADAFSARARHMPERVAQCKVVGFDFRLKRVGDFVMADRRR